MCCITLIMCQVLGRNLEGVVNKAMDLKTKFGDSFVSVEHLVLALADDSRWVGGWLWDGQQTGFQD